MIKKHLAIATILLLLELFAVITFISYPIQNVLPLTTQGLNALVVIAIFYYSIDQWRRKKPFFDLISFMNSLIPGTILAALVSYGFILFFLPAL